MPKIVDHDKKREEILQRCFPLFARLGYATVTMREIAREVGVSTGSLYHYFPNKQALFKQMFRSMSRQDKARAVEQLPNEGREARCHALLDFVEAEQEYFRNLMMMALDYQRHNRATGEDNFIKELIQFYCRAIEEQLDLEAEGLGTLLFNLLLGFVAHAQLAPENLDIEKATKLSRQLVSQAISAGF